MAYHRRSITSRTRSRRNPVAHSEHAAVATYRAPARGGALDDFRGAVRSYPVTFVAATAAAVFLVARMIYNTPASTTTVRTA